MYKLHTDDKGGGSAQMQSPQRFAGLLLRPKHLMATGAQARLRQVIVVPPLVAAPTTLHSVILFLIGVTTDIVAFDSDNLVCRLALGSRLCDGYKTPGDTRDGLLYPLLGVFNQLLRPQCTLEENWHVCRYVVPTGHRHLPHSLVHEPSLIPPHNDGDGVVHVDVGVISPTPESSATAVGVDNTNGVGRI